MPSPHLHATGVLNRSKKQQAKIQAENATIPSNKVEMPNSLDNFNYRDLGRFTIRPSILDWKSLHDSGCFCDQHRDHYAQDISNDSSNWPDGITSKERPAVLNREMHSILNAQKVVTRLQDPRQRSKLTNLRCIKLDNGPFRLEGFANLFWISTAIYSSLKLIQEMRAGGTMQNPLNMLMLGYGKFWPEFVCADLTLLLLSTIVIPTHRIVTIFLLNPNHQLGYTAHTSERFLSRFADSQLGSSLAKLVAIIVPAILPVFAIIVAVGLGWPGIQAGTFVAHSYVIAMKMHSYLAINQEYFCRHVALEKKASFHSTSANDKSLSKENSDTPKESTLQTPPIVAPFTPTLLREITKFDHEGAVTYPNNLTMSNFIHFMLAPTLIYQSKYPRTARIRWPYLIDRTLGILAIITMLSLIVEHYIYPFLMIQQARTKISLLDVLLHLLLPFIICYILVFFLVFEYILNWFAELSRFGDRHFYSDWWNSEGLDEFARKWNMPVHKFLHRHVYSELVHGQKMSKQKAMLTTFLISAILHEIGMDVISGRLSYRFFLMQLGQLPLMWITTNLKINRYPLLANLFFWAGMIIGLPSIAILYCIVK